MYLIIGMYNTKTELILVYMLTNLFENKALIFALS